MFFSLPLFAQDESSGMFSSTRFNLDFGIGNKYWSYAEATLFSPITENKSSILALDLHFMNHLHDSNSNSNEKSLGLVFRQKLGDGTSFIGFNTSYSLYTSWDGNARQTPHLGFEYVSTKITLLANYMFQDKTIHSNSEATQSFHPVYKLDGGNYLQAGEAFTGGIEIVGRYNISNRISLGLGYFDRFGDGTYEVTEKGYLQDPTGQINGGLPIFYEAKSIATNSYLLKSGVFLDAEFTTNIGTLGVQLKNDQQHDFLGMVTMRLPLGGNSKRDLLKDRIHRAYYAPVYKADPDDFGISLLIAAAAAAISESAAAAVAAAGSITLTQAAAAATIVGATTTTAVNIKNLASGG